MPARYARELSLGVIVIGSTNSSTDGRALGSLTFHINSLKILVFAKKEQEAQSKTNPKAQQDSPASEKHDDLPF